ncbi:MAG: hypothetical protein FJ333_10195 [Sphingomonadales bacterium]|nr:hypothetical protein [Sphingomonadales bacterium]
MTMDFSVFKAINNLRPTVTKKTFIQTSSTPSRNLVFPGIGHCIKGPSFSVALPLKHHDQIHIKQKTEEQKSEEVTEPQTGGGSNDEAKIDEILLHSMKHPRMIETSSVTFEKPVKRKSNDSYGKGTEGPPKKKQNSKTMTHKFSFF